MSLGEVLISTVNIYSCRFIVPVMGVVILMLHRLLQDYMAKEAETLNARRKLIFEKAPALLSDYCSKGTYFAEQWQEQSLIKAFVTYFLYRVYSFGTINALKVLMFSRDGPLPERECFARVPLRADNRWANTSYSP